MAEKIIGGVVGSLATAFILWLFGVIGNTAAQIPVPKYAVLAFNQETCPEGWRVYEPARGRYIVGMSRNGSLGSVVGTELTDRENRPAGKHTHSYTDSTIGGDGGKYQWGGSATRTDQPRETSANEAVAGTNAPYVQLLLCEKA